MESFKDKVVVITGGATGIGFSFAKQFGREGSKIILTGRRETRLQEAVAKLTNEGIDAKYYQCDMTDRNQVEEFANKAWQDFGHVDVIINNAGTMETGKSIVDLTKEDFLNIYDVNVFGVLNGSSVFGKRFIEQKTPAAIYNVGSENSLFNGVPTGSAYVSSKHAVFALTESLKEELPEFIDVSLICPGFVTSELGDPENMQFGMDTDEYTTKAMEQLKNNEFMVVSHSYNMVRIDERYKEISSAYEKYAPRYEGDVKYDVRTLIQQITQSQGTGAPSEGES